MNFRTQNRKVPPLGNGFALIATLTMLLLLTLVALGFLSLSAVSLRSGSQSEAVGRARANARLALQIAVGELQKQLGPDQRISANGAIVDKGSTLHPCWMGVWDSWIAGDPAQAPVNENYPSPESHHQTLGSQTDESMRPDYEKKDLHFRRWLVSLDPEEARSVDSAKSLVLDGKQKPTEGETAVLLVGKGALGADADPNDFVSARLQPVVDSENPAATNGRFGWWVGDESQKARVMHDSYASTPPANGAEKIFRGQATGSTGTKLIKDLEGITDAQETRIKGLPSLNSLDLVVNADGKEPGMRNFQSVSPFSQSVLTDVREGGLKRDLSVILEQPIDLANNGDEYMLYAFDDPRFPYLNNPNDARRANSRVPIQDLAAYYQLYDHEPAFANSRKEGVQYTSTALPNSLQIRVPDHDGGNKNRQRLIREYTSLYRRPVITKVQFLVGVAAQPITAADRQNVLDQMAQTTGNPPRPRLPNLVPIRDSDTHKLRLGIMPMVTLWNPNNLPLVMDATQELRYNNPPFGIRWRKHRNGGEIFDSTWFNLGYASDPGTGTSNGQGTGFDLLKLRFAPGLERVVFEPGEVKVFSIPSSTAANLMDQGNVLELSTEDVHLRTVNKWDPFGVFLMRNSAAIGHNYIDAPDVFRFDNAQRAQSMVFGPGDKIAFSIEPDNETVTDRADGRSASSNIQGAGFSLYMLDEGYHTGHYSTWIDSLRHNIMISRNGSGTNLNKANLRKFHGELMYPGFPGGAPIAYENETNAMSGSQIISASNAGEIIALMDFSLSIGCESASSSAGGYGGGRRITSRPFLHSATAAMPFIAQSEKDALYDYGWDWQISKINTVEDSILQAKPGTGNGYYGGGYTVENGTTHVIQSEIPVLPTISIASLSHAHLGGFSLAKAIPVGENPDTDSFWWKSGPVNNPTGVAYQRVTASGQNGLAPHIVQAIGNSYAHPNIPADKSFVTKQRIFDLDEGAKDVPYVDHSYLANKALWDEYFFSSLSPQPSKVELFGGTARTAKQVADDFFFGDGTKLLPNRRMSAYKNNLDQTKLNTLFGEASMFSNGLADKIAAHLMVDGGFNVNSTSVDAWKVLFSSLRGKPVAYYETGKAPLESVSADKTVVNAVALPNAKPISTGAITTPNSPNEQWKAGRELTDDEISQLAEAMVRQVKLRGPFLSLSEFINRRLDGSNTDDMALKGALQAALDDPAVSINASFRAPGSGRTLDGEVTGIDFPFPAAATGPIAYGSTAYVDQADVLRGLAEQLTPRGDTFIIRTYGDSLDAGGKVVARAWCEAVVQRTPEYCDTKDEPHEKPSDLSDANRTFGRQLVVISFRWLDADEV